MTDDFEIRVGHKNPWSEVHDVSPTTRTLLVRSDNYILSGDGTLTEMKQTDGSCTHASSIVRPGTLPAGTGNSAAGPLFDADPSSDLTRVTAKDIDGDHRF